MLECSVGPRRPRPTRHAPSRMGRARPAPIHLLAGALAPSTRRPPPHAACCIGRARAAPTPHTVDSTRCIGALGRPQSAVQSAMRACSMGDEGARGGPSPYAAWGAIARPQTDFRRLAWGALARPPLHVQKRHRAREGGLVQRFRYASARTGNPALSEVVSQYDDRRRHRPRRGRRWLLGRGTATGQAPSSFLSSGAASANHNHVSGTAFSD